MTLAQVHSGQNNGNVWPRMAVSPEQQHHLPGTRDTCPHQLILLHITSHADLSEELIGALLSALAQPGPSLPDAGPVIVVAGSLVMSHKSSLEVLFVCFAGVRIVAAAWAADWLLLVITQD